MRFVLGEENVEDPPVYVHLSLDADGDVVLYVEEYCVCTLTKKGTLILHSCLNEDMFQTEGNFNYIKVERDSDE